MAPLKAGDAFPEGVKFTWVPITDDDPTKCGIPQEYDANKEWEGKKVVIFSVPGAFTPTCSARHLPSYIEKRKELASKGIDIVAVTSSNDAWVLNAWGKVNEIQGDDILFLSDTNSFSKNHAWSKGERNGRWAIVIDKDGKILYADVDEGPGQITASGAEAVLAIL